MPGDISSNVSTKSVKMLWIRDKAFRASLGDTGVLVKKQAYSWFLPVKDRNLTICTFCNHLGSINLTLAQEK